MNPILPEKIENPLGLDGIEFIEFSSRNPDALHRIFTEFGFSKTMQHKSKAVDYYQQNDIRILLGQHAGSFAAEFEKAHGPCVPSMGWRVKNAAEAHAEAVKRGAKDGTERGDLVDTRTSKKIPAIMGIGDSLVYFMDNHADPKLYEHLGFEKHKNPTKIDEKGFLVVDHLTNNVPEGTMSVWTKFYKEIFGFYEVKYFDIRGAKTGLTSFALRSPCGKFSIPINEGTEAKSQINEYLNEYKGAGVQHIAFLTRDILKSLKKLEGCSIEMLDMDDEYYASVFDRVPNVTEDHKEIQKYNVLVDGDEEGYLLQIFTRNLIGPIFIEIIQRKNHFAFGDGNFGALFRSIERDQQRRGVL